ncbi:MAG: Histidinol dehydrogenase [Lentisphaerae bacterium ADurb.Bin242]|nr:MAG: Histidinol dehydrogenase [Lentisphaerae bacterium ADurb.Bin242]
MKIIRYSDPDYMESLENLYNRPDCPCEIEESVAAIVAEVRRDKDAAVCRFLKKFDLLDIVPSGLRVTDAELDAAEKQVDETARAAVSMALSNIQDFARRRLPKNWTYSPRSGVVLGEKFAPMERVGCYIPGGTAPLVSTVLHTAGIAAAAGVPEIVAATPPGKNGEIHPATLYALKTAGVREIYRMGGAYAIAALAYGTETVRKVDKIVGPGNAYVAAAKKQVYGKVAVDMVAGPSEIMIVADAHADPEFIAADMLSQAEHGSGLEQAVLVTDSPELPEKVIDAIRSQTEKLGRREAVERVLSKGVFLIAAKDMEEALRIAGRYAPEHLELMFEGAEKRAGDVKAAGAIFVGRWTPEPAGDFTAGPSHVLPTGGTARFFHGLSVTDFMRRSSIVNYSREALLREAGAIETFAEMEGLDAHGKSAAIRKKGI